MGHRIFMSVGEPSGDLHGANLIHQLRAQDDSIQFTGLGGPRMSSAGAELLYPLANHPIMGLQGALAAVPFLRRLLAQVEKKFRTEPPSAVILIDNPGFNWHIARLAKRHSIPVVYYVPPQIWAWASHRVAKIRKYVDLVLCTLPFEEAWYQSRGVTHVRYVGHPFFDDLANDTACLPSTKSPQSPPRVVLLPGSRWTEARLNTDLLVRSAAKIKKLVPNVTFDVAAFAPRMAELARQTAHDVGVPLDVYVGQTRERMAEADAAISVSGSVSLELLYMQMPAAIVYHVNWFWEKFFIPTMLHSPYVTLVNLLAGKQVYPEYLGSSDHSEAIAETVSRWLLDPEARARVTRTLTYLKREYAAPGAGERAATAILDLLAKPSWQRQAA